MTGNYEGSRSNRENLPFPIQIKLSKKPLTFCDILLAFVVSTWNFQCSEKKWTSEVRYSWNCWLRKMCLFKYITGLVSENPLAVKMLTSPKTPEIWRKVLLTYLFFILSQIELEKVIFNQIWEFRTGWLHIDRKLRVFS